MLLLNAAGQNLHAIDTGSNPYISVLSIICRTLRPFDDDQKIPAYGFGDVSSRDHSLFSFAPGDQPIHTFENVLARYKSFVGRVQMSGPTTFAPAIYQAVKKVQEDGRYHILVIVCDGQVSCCVIGTICKATGFNE